MFLQNKTHIHRISSLVCNRVSATKFQNRKHIGGYRDVQKTSLSKFNQEHDGKLKHRKKNIGKQECSAENEVKQEL